MSRFAPRFAAMALVFCAGAAQADISFEHIINGTITDVSADGAWVAGFLNTGGIYRWSQGTGTEILEMNTSYNGSVGISSDGSRVAASIINGSGVAGPGVWTQGSGWQYLGPISGGGVDNEDGSAYCISDDGTTVAGLAWRADYRARGFSWTQGTGMVNLGSTFDDRSSRASAINGDGSVIGGFDEAEFGNRRPAVWVNGALTVIEPDGVGEVTSVNMSGNMVGGDAGYDVGAATWSFDGANWNRTDIGYLPGTDDVFRAAQVLGLTPDGSMAVGFNASGFGPFASYDGTIWTAADGLVNVEDWLTARGVDFGGMDIRALTGISDDGNVLVGYGFLGGFAPQGFRIVIPAPASVAMLGLGGLVAIRRRR